MASSHTTADAMTIMYVTCTNCRQKYVLPREAAGLQKKCKICQAAIQIPWESYFSEGGELKPSESSTILLSDRSSRDEKARIAKRLVLSFEQGDETRRTHRFSMHNTKGEVLRRKLWRLFANPIVWLLTILVGVFLWQLSNGVWSHWDSFGVAITTVALAAITYRITAGTEHTALAREDLRRIGKRNESARLRQIQLATSNPHDRRLTHFLERLDSAFTRLQQVDRWRCSGKTMKSLEIAEIHDQTCRLYLGCRNMLEQAQVLFDGASQMETATARERVMNARRTLLSELQTNLEHLDHVLDEVYSSQLPGRSQPIVDASELREELSRRVEVARQIEERLEQFTGQK